MYVYRPERLAAYRAQQRRNRMLVLTSVTIVVLSLALAIYFLISTFWWPVPPPIADNVIDVAATMEGFDAKEVHVKMGEPVTIRLTSLDNAYHTDGGGKHQWAVDELGVSVVAPPNGSKYVTFTPDKPGEYTFYCGICCGDRFNPVMRGKLIVQA